MCVVMVLVCCVSSLWELFVWVMSWVLIFILLRYLLILLIFLCVMVIRFLVMVLCRLCLKLLSCYSFISFSGSIDSIMKFSSSVGLMC